MVLTVITHFEGDTTARIQAMRDGTHNPYRDFNQFINALFYQYSGLTFLSKSIVEHLGLDAGYYATTYVRDLFLGTAVYWGTAGAWHVFIYYLKADEYFRSKNRPFPSMETIADQILVAQSALFLYAALPILSEYLIENNLTRTYFYLDEIGGWGNYILYLLLYVVCFEFGIYWVHRILHENKFLYKYVHLMHHKYKSSSTLTPWCSLAFNPIDGILQVRTFLPYDLYKACLNG